MGSVGSIEKVMVGGILVIILLILAVAINGSQDDPNKVDWENADETTTVPKLSPGGSGDPTPGPTPGPGNDNVNNHVVNLTDPLNNGGQGNGGQGYETIDPPRVLPPSGDDLPPAVTPPSQPPRNNYTVKKGDTFGGIAQRVLGSVRYVSDLQKSNEDVDANKMHVGQVLNLPRVGKLADGGSEPAPVVSDGPKTNTSSAGGSQTHQVVKGDTFYAISRQYYGTVGHWKKILNANSAVLTNPKSLAPGMVLSIPPL